MTASARSRGTATPGLPGPPGPPGEPGAPGAPGAPGSDADATAAIATHGADTTDVHGITDTALLATRAELAGKLDAADADVPSMLPLVPVRPSWRGLALFTPPHGFVKQTTVGVQADDPADAPVGSSSLVLTTDGIGGVLSTRRSNIAPAVDLTGRQVAVALKVDDHTRIADLILYVSSDNMATNANARIVPSTVPATQFVTSGDWVVVTLSQGEFTGAVNWGAVNAIQLRAKDRAAGAFTVRFGGLWSMPRPARGVVSITCDDGWVSQYTEMRRKLDERRMPATAYIICDRIDVAGFMSLGQVQALQDVSGWEVASHAFTLGVHDARFPNVPLDVLEDEFRAMKRWLADRGLRAAHHIAYPGGAFDAAVLRLVQKHFGSGRTIYSPSRETLPPPAPPKLRAWSVTNTDTLAAVQAAVTRAAVNGEWLVLCFHQIVAAPTVSTQWAVADFNALVDFIAGADVDVRTVGDALRGA